MKNKKSFGILLSFVLVLAGFIFGSCEIGLGAAVDTEAPAIGITAPEVDAVIRDKFAIRGTWSDDGDIDSLTAKLKRTDGNGEPIIYNGVADVNTGKWQIIVDPEKENILDGSYEVTVSIKDKGQHVTTQSRTFKIDNTPPLIVLQRPSSKADATSVDTYGQSFTLTGQAADDNNIEHIYVNIYRDSACTDFVTTVDLKNVPPTIEQDVAKFELGVNNDYAAIYGYLDKGHGTVGSYCTINAYDGAQRYPIEGEQTDEDKLGNTTNVYYLYNDIAAAILSETKITEVYHMLDGTSLLKDASRTAAVDNIKTILNANAVTIGSFSLNPDNNPIFTVSGQSPLACNGNDFTADQSHYISNGLTVVVEVSPGLDAIPLDAESLKVYFQECDLNGEPLPNAEKIYYDGNSTLSGSSYKFETLISTTAGLRVGGNYIIDVEGVDQKGNAVRPKSSKYGFHLASNASAPILTVTSPSENLIYKKKGDAQEFAGTISVEEGKPTLTINIGNDNYYTHQVTDADLISSENGKLYGFSFTVPAGGDHGFNQTTSSQYGFTIKASSEGLSSAENRTIIYDVDAPVITIQQITPTAYKYLDEAGTRETDTNGNPVKYLNGLINVKLTISDAKSGVDITTQKPKYEFFLGNSTVPQTLPTYTLDPYGQEINNIDTTAWLNQNGTPYTGPVTFKVTAYDIAGNEKVETIEYQVDQDTDKPVLLPYDASSTTWTMATAGNEPHGINEVTTEGGVQVKNNKNIFINGSQLNLKLIDDDGIKNLKYYYGKLTVDTANNFAFTRITDFGPSKGEFTDNAHSTETTYPCNLPSESGYYQFKVVVTDVNNKSTTVGPFVIKTTPAGADVTIINNNKFIKKDSGDSFTNTIKVENSDQAPFKVYRKLKAAESWGDSIHTIGINDNNTCDDVVQINSTATYQYKVVDDNGHESNVAEIVLTVDGGNPELALTSGTDDIALDKIKLNSFTFKGTAEDKATSGTTDTPSGIDKVYLQVANGNNPNAAGYKYRKVVVSGTSDWFYELPFEETVAADNINTFGNKWREVFDVGKKYVTVIAVDKVGNESTVSQIFVYDKEAPWLGNISTNAIEDNGKSYITNGNLVITGKAYDSYKLTSVSIFDGNIEYTETSTPAIVISGHTKEEAKDENSAATLTFTLPVTGTGAIGNGSHTFKVVAKDEKGNIKESDNKVVIVDTVAPTITLDALPTNNDTKTSNFTFQGTANDGTSGIDTIFLTIANGANPSATGYKYRRVKVTGKEDWYYKVTYSDNTEADGTISFGNKWNEVFADQGVKYVSIEIKDKAGNTNTTYSLAGVDSTSQTFTYDKEDPSLTVNSSSVRNFIPTAGYDITGTAYDTYNFAGLTITEYILSGTDYVINTHASITENPKSINRTGNNWSAHVPLGTVTEGTYKYVIEAKDSVGNTVSWSKDGIKVDRTAPVVTVVDPSEYSANNTITFKGFIGEENKDTCTATLQKWNGTAWENVPNNEYELNVDSSITDPTQTNWSQKIYDLENAKYKLYVKAVDQARNEGVACTSEVTVDTTFPTSTIFGTNLVKDNGVALSHTENINTQGETIYYAKEVTSGAAYTISGTVTEEHFDSSRITLKVKKDDGAVVTKDLTWAGKTWSYNFSSAATDGTDDGAYKYTLSVTDLANNRTEYTINVTYDTQKPTLVINEPVQNGFSGSTPIAANGSIKDSGIGLKEFKWTTDDGATWTDWTDTSNGTIDRRASSWQMNFAPTAQGEIKLKMKAVDYLGHEFITPERRFSYDYENPVATGSSNAVNGYIKSGNLVLTGKAWDSNKFDSISILDETNSGQITYTEPAISITGTKASAKTEGTAVDWTLTLPTSGTGAIENGSHKFTITAKDDAGRTASPASIIIIVDTVAPKITLEALPSRTDTQAPSFTFRGTGSDVTSGVEKVELTIANGTNPSATEYKYRTVKATGKENWYYSVVFEDETPEANETGASGNTWKEVFADEGVKKVTLKVYDKAGLSEDKFTLGEETTEVTEKTFTFDKANPVITLNQGTVLEYMPEGGFDITGTVSDTYKLAGTTEGTNCVTVEEYYKAPAADSWPTEAQKTQTFSATGVNNHSGAISIHVPLNSGTTQDGRYKYKITVKDSMDNKGTYSTSDQGIIVDKTAPEVTITTPSSDTSHTDENAIHEQSFKFIGGFIEANEISGIYYKIIKSGTEVPDVPEGNVILDATWEGAGFTKVTAGSSTWNSFQSFTTGNTGDYCEGENYQICVYGVDKATNVSTVTTCTFDVDMSAPEIKTQVKENGGSYTDLTVDSTQTKTKTYEFRYYAKDTYGLNGSETVTVKKDGDEIGETTSTTTPYYTKGTADGYKVITITVPDGVKQDGLYEYTISATDKVGKQTEVNRSIRLDRFGPTIAVQSPDLEAYQANENVTVSGSSDDDSGTLAVYYAYGVSSAPSMPAKGTTAKTAANWSGWTAATGTTSWNFTVTGEEAQNKNLYIVAVDKNGLYENPISKVVRVDKSDPKSAFTKPNAYVSGGNLVLTGTVWDENGIKEVKVSYGTSASGSYGNSELPKINTTGTTYTAQTESEAKTKLAAAKSSTTTATWKSEIALADGKYNFKVEIKDDAGKVKTETFEVTMDNTPPEVTAETINWGSSTVTPHNISTATLSFTVTEANVKSVSYFIDNKSSPITQNTVPSNKWSSISSNTNEYSTNLTFGDGDGNIYIKVEDMAGNVAYGTAQTYDVDTAKPDVCTILEVNESTETSTIMVNGRSAVPFIVKATDFNAKYSYNSTTLRYEQKGADPAQIASVSLLSVGSYTVPTTSPINGTKTNATTGEWTIEIPTEAFTSLNSGAKPVSVKVTDKAGNSQNFTNLFTLTLDKTAPTVGISPVKSADTTSNDTYVNGTFKLEGTSRDSGGSEVESIDICYYVNATDGWQWHSRVTEDLSNWTSADIDTTALTDSTTADGKVADDTTVTFVAIATDTSENKNTDVNGVDKTVAVTGGLKPAADVDPSSISTAISLIVDQDTDRPTVKFTNLNEENGSYVLKYGTNSILEGTISDDDSTESAVVETFIVSNEEITNTTGWTITPNATGDTITSTKANCGTTVFNKKTGSYTFTPAVTTDGSKTVYFYLVDNGGKIYYTGNTATLNKPYQQYKTDAKVDNNAAITYLSDSTAPTIHKVYAHAYKGETKEDEDIALGTSCIVGGTERNGIDLVVEATDANAITKIVVELDDGTETDKKTYTYTYTDTNFSTFNEAGVTYYKAEMPKKVLSTEFPAITSTSERDYVDVTVTVYDGVGLYSNQSSLFVIDLKGPTFNISQPAENSVLYGVNENLVTGTPSATDVSKFYYYVTKAADTEIADNDWIEIGGESKISKTLVFDGDSVGTHETNVGWHCKTLREWIKTAYNVTEAVLTADDTNKDLYVRFKLVDNCGNIGYSSRKFVIIPNGDMPTLQVTYPLADAKLGGTIRCTGTTEIYTDEISGVYAQIDVSGVMTANWESTLSAKTDKYTVVDTGVSSGDYTRGIKVSGSPYSWNFSINGSSEFNDVEYGKVAIRFFAVSTQNHKVSPVGANQTRIITIDANAPIFNSMRLVQFAADGTTITASKAYEEDMWITGQWYIYGDITDDNGVKSITYEDTSEHALVEQVTGNELSGDVTTNTTYKEYVIQGTTNHANVAGNKAYDYTLKIPIGSSESNVFGTTRYTVKAIDATNENNSSQKIFIVNYDNKAPEFKATVSAAANAAELATTGIEIKQSNAGYSFNGQFNEEGTANANQSGFGRILMYFTRTINSTTNIIDVSTTKVESTGTNYNKNNYLGLEELTLGDDGYWKSATANISAENTLAVTGLPTFARKGGVVKIDSVLYRITSISGTTVEVDGVLTNAQNKPVYFTPALVIDNLSTESVKEGVTYTGLYSTADDSTSLTNGDGDWLIEGVTKSGASYPWTAMINSTNILDGPITVHFVAYDAAGNMVTKSYSGNVANNAPRLAGVTIWTDYNGDGTGWRPGDTGYKDETKSSYASRVRPEIVVVEGQPKERVDRSNAVTNSLEVYGGTSDAKTSYMKITDQVKFIPELVGGNGALYYSFDITGNTGASGIAAADKQGALKNDSGTAVSGTADGDDATIASTLTLQDDDSTSYIAGHTDGVITFPVDKVISKLVNTTNNSSPTWFNVKIWDSTEGGTVYTDTLNCEMKVALDIKYTDDTAPLTYVDDLYWKGATDNSVYKDVNNNLYGHVELKSDYANKVASPTTAANYSELVANYGNNDDKVSGKVVFRGTAYDNKRLGSLTWNIDKSVVTSNSVHLMTGTTINYTNVTVSGATTAQWSTSGNLSDSTPYKFTATDVYCNSDGHKVSWELVVDTSYISGVVAKDACVVVTATDKWTTPNSNSKTTAQYIAEDATDATRSRPLYQVDVVPYITNVETRLSKKDLANTSVYSRTAKGHYAIASNEGAIKLSGYNLTAKSVDVTLSAETVAALTTGAYSLTVTEGISTINNMNNNDAVGSYTSVSGTSEENKVKNMYNRQPNTTTNLKLTDDVYFDVWDLNQTSVASNGALKDPVMHINPSTNQIGFGFVNAVDAVSFPTSEYSYRIMEKNNKDYIGTNFAYDSNGNAHTISIGLDAQQHTSIAGRMNYIYSKWWYNSNDTSRNANNVRNWNKTNAIALESIGIPRDIYVKGTPNSADLIDIDRFPNPKIAVATHGNTPTVYVMYYDADHDQIRFRQGSITDYDNDNNSGYTYNNGNESNSTRRERTVGRDGRDRLGVSTRNNTWNQWGNENTNDFINYGLLNDSKSEHYRHGDTENTSIPNSDGTNYDNHGMFEASKEYYAIVTGDYYNQTNYTINNGTAGQLGYSTGNKGSKYYAMDVIAGTAIGSDKVVMIWFDNSTQKLMYAYRTNITETSNMDASSAGVKNGNTIYWSVPKSVFGDTALPLQDCVIKADSKGGIHIAAYDLISADLKYAYMPSYNHLDTSGNTAYTCTVDAYSQCGNCLQIDTVLDSTGNKVIPYISYLSEGMFYLPKVAFIPGGIDPSAPGNAIKDGADKDTKLFTGNWEVSLIPTTSELQKYNVCIGVWRDADGKITTPTKGTDAATGTTDRKRYANGNTNLVLGYSHKLNGIGYMETAMYKGIPTY